MFYENYNNYYNLNNSENYFNYEIKENFTASIAKLAMKEGAEKVAKEAAEKIAKESAQKVAKEAAQKAAKEGAEKVAKEAAQKVAKEAAEKAAKEGAEKVAKEAAEKVAKEGAEKAAKTSAAKTALKNTAKVAAGGYVLASSGLLGNDAKEAASTVKEKVIDPVIKSGVEIVGEGIKTVGDAVINNIIPESLQPYFKSNNLIIYGILLIASFFLSFLGKIGYLIILILWIITYFYITNSVEMDTKQK